MKAAVLLCQQIFSLIGPTALEQLATIPSPLTLPSSPVLMTFV